MFNKDYFDANVMYSVEFDNGYRYRNIIKGSELDKALKDRDDISDIEFAGKQPDAWCRKVCNLAYYNWFNNRSWWNNKGLHSLYEVVDYIIDNNLARV